MRENYHILLKLECFCVIIGMRTNINIKGGAVWH